MFNTLAQYFLGTANNTANNLEPDSAAAAATASAAARDDQKTSSNLDAAGDERKPFDLANFPHISSIAPNKRARGRHNRKNRTNNNNNSKGNQNQQQQQQQQSTPEQRRHFHLISTHICDDSDDWLLVEYRNKSNKKNGFITLHGDCDDVSGANAVIDDLTCSPVELTMPEPPRPRIEIKHANPLNLTKQQLKRLHGQNAAVLISSDDIQDDADDYVVDLMRGGGRNGGRRNSPDACAVNEIVVSIDPDQSAIVDGRVAVDIAEPSVACGAASSAPRGAGHYENNNNSNRVVVLEPAMEVKEEEAAVTDEQQQQTHDIEEPQQMIMVYGLADYGKMERGMMTLYPRPGQQRSRNLMEESWFVTPPSCFTSQGPVNMETSPLENLLIEHPSMSVYHGVSSGSDDQMTETSNNIQTIDESLVVLNYEQQQQQQSAEVVPAAVERTPTHNEEDEEPTTIETAPTTTMTTTTEMANVSSSAPRSAGIDFFYREAKQCFLFRNAQMNHDKKTRQKLCRNAMTRSNKTMEINATKNGPKKRSEKQHAKSASRANNNRKC